MPFCWKKSSAYDKSLSRVTVGNADEHHLLGKQCSNQGCSKHHILILRIYAKEMIRSEANNFRTTGLIRVLLSILKTLASSLVFNIGKWLNALGNVGWLFLPVLFSFKCSRRCACTLGPLYPSAGFLSQSQERANVTLGTGEQPWRGTGHGSCLELNPNYQTTYLPARSGPASVFVNRDWPQHKHPHYLLIVYGCLGGS